MVVNGAFRRLGGDRRGASAVEFALIAPLLLALMAGIFSYGGYFWTSHTLQQLANDCARAAIAGLDDDERRSLAEAALAAGAESLALVGDGAPTLSVSRRGETFEASVSYDGATTPFWVFEGLAPMPSKRMTRSARVRLGGF